MAAAVAAAAAAAAVAGSAWADQAARTLAAEMRIRGNHPEGSRAKAFAPKGHLTSIRSKKKEGSNVVILRASLSCENVKGGGSRACV